jgi:hypothetical protein
MRCLRTGFVCLLLTPFLTVIGGSQKATETRPAMVAPRPMPAECTGDATADTGTPVMFSFPSTKGLVWGISAQSTPYRGAVPLLLWVCNVTDEPQPVATCAAIDRFWVQGIEIFDSLGHRVPTIEEETEKRLREAGKPVPLFACEFRCTRNFAIYIPAHASMHGRFSQQEYDFARDLRIYYSLAPGKYFIVPSERGEDCKPIRATLNDTKNGLSIFIGEE